MPETEFLARVDSPNAKNGELNLDVQNTDALTINFVGDLNLEQDDQDTLVTIDGTVNGTVYDGSTQYSFSVEFVGTMPSVAAGSTPGALGKVPDVLEGEKVILITITDIDNGGEPLRFIFFPDTDPDEATIGAIAESAIPLVGTNFNPPPEPICFLRGTLVQTRTGPVCVEDFKVGDLVLTGDESEQPLAWISSTLHSWPGSEEKHKPILIQQGALGDGLPTSDLMVSPQHHVVFKGAICVEMFGAEEALAPAKGLTGLAGVRIMAGKKEAEYFHLLTPQHEVLFAHGVETESFYPGQTALKMMGVSQRASLLSVVPSLRGDPENGYGPPARKKITRRQAEKLVVALKLAKRAERAIM